MGRGVAQSGAICLQAWPALPLRPALRPALRPRFPPRRPMPQCFMLTEAHRRVLREQYRVHPWHFEQVRRAQHGTARRSTAQHGASAASACWGSAWHGGLPAGRCLSRLQHRSGIAQVHASSPLLQVSGKRSGDACALACCLPACRLRSMAGRACLCRAAPRTKCATCGAASRWGGAAEQALGGRRLLCRALAAAQCCAAWPGCAGICVHHTTSRPHGGMGRKE